MGKTEFAPSQSIDLTGSAGNEDIGEVSEVVCDLVDYASEFLAGNNQLGDNQRGLIIAHGNRTYNGIDWQASLFETGHITIRKNCPGKKTAIAYMIEPISLSLDCFSIDETGEQTTRDFSLEEIKEVRAILSNFTNK